MKPLLHRKFWIPNLFLVFGSLMGCASEMRNPTVLGYVAQSQAGFVVRDLDRKWSAERVQDNANWQSGQNAAMAASSQGIAALRAQPAPCFAAWGATCR